MADRRMLIQEIRQSHRTALMCLHARSQRLDSAQNQPGIKRRAGQSQRIDDVADLIRMLFRLGDDATTDDIGMPVQILGGRVNHHIDTMLERSLAIGGQEGVVRDGDQSRRFCHLGNGSNVNDVKQGIAGGFDPDTLGLGRNRLADLFDISHADEDEVDPRFLGQIGPLR